MDANKSAPLPEPDDRMSLWDVSGYPASIVLHEYRAGVSPRWATCVSWYGDNEYGERDHDSRADAEARVRRLLAGEWKEYISQDAIAAWTNPS